MKTLLPLCLVVLFVGCTETNPATVCKVDADCAAGQSCQNATCADLLVPSECAPGATRACGNAAVGSCRQGLQRCVDGRFEQGCPGEVKPSTEICNGVDDDCDGQLDEGVTQTFFRDDDQDGFGLSSMSVTACTRPPGYADRADDCDDQAGSGASIHPGAQERCDVDSFDEDCDGMRNEGCACQSGMTMACCSGRGVQTCELVDGGTALSSCSVVPAAEVCNGVDDDCDGTIDDGACLDAGQNVDSGVAVDAGSSVDAGSAIDGGVSVDAGLCFASPETCNGLDDDCDSFVDEGLDAGVSCGVGRCERMVAACEAGSATVCTPGTPSTELCNNLDDDCDGAIDEDLGSATCGVGACRVAVAVCSFGSTQTCTPGFSRPEVCNNVDDDCDGTTDDGLGSSSCGVGACARTVQNCVSGQTQFCTPGTPGVESCNSLDDDCDGSTDETLGASSCGLGACARTVQNCVSGQAQSCTPGTPGTEICNNVDDDCDGSADEGLLVACYADDDGDLYATNTTQVMRCPDPSRTAAGFCPVGFVAPASSIAADCAPTNAQQYRFMATRTDGDNDTTCTGVVTFECVGTTAPAGRRFSSACAAEDDCNDGNQSLYRLMSTRGDADSDAFCAGTAISECVGATAAAGRRFTGACLGDDCNDASGSVFRVATVRFDSDGDQFCAGTAQSMCIGNAPPGGYRISTSCLGEDCRDSNASATSQCTLVNAYTTSSRTSTCPSGTVTSTLTVQTFCPIGFVLGTVRAQVSAGMGLCTTVSATQISQTCNFLEGTTCRIVGDCVAQ